MTDQNNNSPPNGPTSRRRSSFAGQAFADIFGNNRSASISESSNSPPGQQYSGPITAAAAHANQRRLSLTTIGLSNSPPSGGAYFGNRTRRDSISSSNNASVDESAVEEEPMSANTSQPSTPFGRRVSFGARALRDMNNKNGNGGNNGSNGRVSTSTIPEENILFEGEHGGGRGGKNSSPIDVAGSAKTTVPTIAKGRGLSSSSTGSPSGRRSILSYAPFHGSADVLTFHDRTEPGFNWADNMRTRAERGSISGGVSMGTSPTSGFHARAKSIAVMDQPVRETPRPAPALDHTQERILKGDFYMD